MEPIRKVYVVFKTHFDYGYTALAKDVLEQYMRVYIPAALTRAEEMRAAGGDRFIWTTGSWLIQTFLETAALEDRARMERAIEDGDVRWHALPFTTHTELMDRELFEYGLSISRRLDGRFGVKTAAAKLTDVPGHTRAIIDPLADAGVTLLHIGDNPTSRAPAVPELFRWRAPSGKQISVIYSKGYGQPTQIPGTGALLYFAHTGDNAGPQSMQQILALYERLRAQYPGAEVVAGTLEDIAREVETICAQLPVLTCEVGDSWIHGVGSDPRKVSDFRALLRLRADWPQEAREAVNRCLLRVPEHTWGSFINPIMNDRHLYGRKAFEAVRGEERYQFMEATWQEQRAFVAEAVEALGQPQRAQAESALAAYTKEPERRGTPTAPDAEFCLGQWRVRLDGTGAICGLRYKDRTLADEEHRLGVFLYEVFSREETDRYGKQYIETRYFPNLESISWELFTKPGIQCAIDQYASAHGALEAVRADESVVQADIGVHSPLVEQYGCPARLTLEISTQGDALALAYRWRDKAASRVPEGIWLGMNPIAGGCRVRKLGEWIDPMDVVAYGNRQMCATDWGVAWKDVSLESLDTALLSWGVPALWRLDLEQPQLEKGVWFNLFNNMWNTNFPMWYEEDALFRFVVRCANA